MKLTDTTYKKMIDIMQENYVDWVLPGNQKELWRRILTSKVSDELLPRIVSEWISNETKPPKTSAELVHYLDEKIKKQFGSAETESDIIISSARKAYYVTDDFQTFTEEYSNSFASMLGTPAQEVYIRENIDKCSKSPKILILVYDELKGEVEDCFKGDAEHGIEFLRNHIKKNWNTKVDDAVKEYLKTGMTDFMGLSGGKYGQLEA